MGKGNRNLLKRPETPGISLITAVKNREETLRQAISSWLKLGEIDEIIIVDWSSDQSLAPLVKSFADDRICLIRVEGQEKWILSFAYNLAACCASRDKLLKTDADVLIKPDFFEKNILTPGSFISGDWRMGRDDNEKHLNGTVFLYRSDFIRVNGYNEYIKSYGWDDSDLYTRLEAVLQEHKYLDLDTLYHIPHKKRTKHQVATQFLKNIDDHERAAINILINRYITEQKGTWTHQHKMVLFSVKKIEKNLYHCKQAGADANIVSDELFQKAESVAVRERLEQKGFAIYTHLATYFTKDELISLYQLLLCVGKKESNQTLFQLINKYNYHFTHNFTQHSEKIARLQSQTTTLEKELSVKETELSTKANDIKHITNEKDGFIDHLNNIIRDNKAEINNLTISAREKERQLGDQARVISEKEQEIDKLNGLVQQEKTQIEELQHFISVQEHKLGILNYALEQEKSQIDELQHFVSAKERLILEKDKLQQSANLKIFDLENNLAEQKNQIMDLQSRLEKLYQSYSWRFGHFVFSMLARLASWIK